MENLQSAFNPLGWLTSIQEFLAMECSSLDVWFSFQLQQQAMSAGSLVDAVEFLMSEGVQDEVLGMLTQAVANSLDVERKHNQDKASESVKTKGMPRFRELAYCGGTVSKERNTSSNL